MSKRFNPQQYGERKKAKLDISYSDYNFPLSQNPAKDDIPTNSWGDDNADELLLMASQACEQAMDFNHDVSLLPNYSMCMQPASTSTQINVMPGTSSSNFQFKKPFSNSIVSTHLKDKCERISSPLPGLSKECNNGNINYGDDFIVNDRNKDQNLDYMYREIQLLREENTKLTSENGKLLEKCITKEGESSILRTQLKTCQQAVDNVRLEKIKAQEKAQMEWADKITAANNQLHDLRTQLDFKNLEIISMKERCKMMESSKVKLTQVMLPANGINMSQRHNHSITYAPNDFNAATEKVKTTSHSVQTEEQSHFLTICIPQREEQSRLSQILPPLMEPAPNQCCILDYNEKLKPQTNIQNKYRIFNTFHRLPATSVNTVKRKDISLLSICEDLSYLDDCKDGCMDKYINIFKTIREVIHEVRTELETVSQRMTTAFQKEMDQRYIDVTSTMEVVDTRQLLLGRPLYEEEQGVTARRLTAVLAHLIQYSAHKHVINKLLLDINRQTRSLVLDLKSICVLLDNATCAILYSGLLQSTIQLLRALHPRVDMPIVLQLIETIIHSRPRLFVSCHILNILSVVRKDLNSLCSKSLSGNLKSDNDQGVLLYKKESCALQVLLKQIECAFKCMDRQRLPEQAVDATRNIIIVYNSLKESKTDSDVNQRCDCEVTLLQVLVYGLRICSSFINTSHSTCDSSTQMEVQSVSVCGLSVMYWCVTRNVEFLSRLGHSEGHLLVWCENMKHIVLTDVYSNMLLELTNSLQSMEERAASVHADAWLADLRGLSLAE